VTPTTMSGESQSRSERRTRTESEPSVLAIAGLVVPAMLAVPIYYCLDAVVPLSAVVPPTVPLAITAVGLCVLLPGQFLYAHYRGADVTGGSPSVPEYGVDDRWERRNL
jgi:hypothetical protein